jgi:hypothetical protein
MAKIRSEKPCNGVLRTRLAKDLSLYIPINYKNL